MSIFKSAIFVVAITCAGFTATDPSATAQHVSADIAWGRAQSLQHGIDASLWFAQSRDYTVERLRSFTTEDDITLMEKLGFDHVRLSPKISAQNLASLLYSSSRVLDARHFQ
nr:hypothetical protein [Granulicella sp. L60]